MRTGGPAVVLVRPQLAVNIGMCARAMANFGLDDLRLVNPKSGWPRTDEYKDVAYSAAAGAAHLLDAARVFPSTEAAIADLHFVYAATARERGQAKPVLTPAAAMPEAAAATGQKRGILFGPERTGLENDEVALADAVLTFPTNPAYGSLNLAQAVLLVGYEWFKAAHGDVAPTQVVPRPVSPPAPRGHMIADCAGVLAQHHHDPLAVQPLSQIDGVVDQRAAADRVQHLRPGRLHARALAGGQDDGGALAHGTSDS